jgi:hypothetical protein
MTLSVPDGTVTVVVTESTETAAAAFVTETKAIAASLTTGSASKVNVRSQRNSLIGR